MTIIVHCLGTPGTLVIVLLIDDPAVIASDSVDLRLYVKESLKIKELSAYKYLNANISSLELNLW